MTIDHFHKQFEYDYWASTQTLNSVKKASDPPEKVYKLLSHLVAAEWTWLSRLGHPSPDLQLWGQLTLDQVTESLDQIRKAWAGFFESRDDADLDRIVSYKNSRGEIFENIMRDILTHILYHGAYHRGQIATLLRDSGNEPAVTDYIFAVRERLL